MTPVTVIDFETYPICAQAPFPKVVCAVIVRGDGDAGVRVLGNGDGDQLEPTLRAILEGDDKIVFHNAAFDLTCWAASYPEHIELLFRAVTAFRCDDTMLREGLLNLSSHGQLEKLYTPNGSSSRISYQLGELTQAYFGIDRSQAKSEDSWRMHFMLLDGKRASEYPQDALAYVRDDGTDTWNLYWAQQRKSDTAAATGRGGSVHCSEFHTAASFCLALNTAWGCCIDQSKVAEFKALLDERLCDENMAPLYEAGLVDPPTPERPYANGAIDKQTGLPKMVAAKPAKKNMAAIHKYIYDLCEQHQIECKKTEKGEPTKNDPYAWVSTESKFVDDLAPLDPVMAVYKKRQDLQKLSSTEIPRIDGKLVVHPRYDSLKATLRTSSFGSKKGVPLGQKGNLYPSVNIQQIPKEIEGIEMRQCFVPRPGHCLIAVDFSTIELVTWAQTCLDLLGHSVMADVLRSGKDAHAYQATAIVREWDNFQGGYEDFVALKKGNEEQSKFYNDRRTLAKPVGLGFPGGLSAETLRKGPARQYGFHLQPEQAKQLRTIWFNTFTEAKPYFDWVSRQRDTANDRIFAPENPDDEEWGDSDGEVEKREAYYYTSPYGVVRRGATWCATANGKGLQTPTAEGAKTAILYTVPAFYVKGWNNAPSLFGCRLWAFIHDELIVEAPDDGHHIERGNDIKRLMAEGMSRIVRDIPINLEATLMRERWSKSKKYFDEVW